MCSSAHLRPNLQPPLAKYLHGAGRVDDSTSCENGHIRPAWHWPCRKNLHGTCCVSSRRLSLVESNPRNGMYSLLFLGGLLGMPANANPPISPGIPPYCLSGPAIGIGSEPFLSACILGAAGGVGIESAGCLCGGGRVLPPFTPAKGTKPFIARRSRAKHTLVGFAGLKIAQDSVEAFCGKSARWTRLGALQERR